MKLTVTFDSNVWESIVDEEKRNNSIWAPILYQMITEEKIIPFFSAGLATYEAVRKAERIDFFRGYDGSQGVELSEYLKNMIPKAIKMGFTFLKFPRIGGLTPDLENFESHVAISPNYSLGQVQERTFECARFIEDTLRCGKAHVKDEQLRFLNNLSNTMSDIAFAKGVAEWADGDSLASHYGYGIEFYCTNDMGRSAGNSSIFSDMKKSELIRKFQIKIASPEELIDLTKLS